MFSLLLCFKSMEVDSELNVEEKQLLLLALGGGAPEIPKPAADWLTDVSWGRICELDKLKRGPWQNFAQTFKQNVDGWKVVFDAQAPLETAWPAGTKESMNAMQRAMVILAIRPDCAITGLQEVIAAKLGRDFLEPPSFNLEKSFNGSNNVTP